MKLEWDGSEHGLDARVPVSDETRVGQMRGVPVAWRMEGERIVAFHKPIGCVTSQNAESRWPSAFDWLSGHERHGDLRAVGRLDAETSGLLLLTTYGPLVQALAHPARGVERTYRVTMSRPIAQAPLSALTDGEIVLHDGHRPRPSRIVIDPDDACVLYMTLREGKYHEVRRTIAAMGSHVQRLHRAAWGPLGLAPTAPDTDLATWEGGPHSHRLRLAEGEWKDVTEDGSSAAVAAAVWAAGRLTPPPRALRVWCP
jgi:pseudouridine synthase